MNRDFDLMKIVREKLDIALPPNAHDLCSGRIRISVTRIRDMENVILSDFNSKEELLDVSLEAFFRAMCRSRSC